MGRWDELPPAPLIPKPKTLRQTALRYADQCPRSAYLYWANDGGVPSSPLFRGRVFHAVAERSAKACIAHGEERIDHHDVKAILQEVLLEHPEWPVTASDMEPLRQMCFHFAEHFHLPPGPLVEQLFHLDVSESTVSGTVDLAWVEDQTLFIRDYKASLGGVPSWDDITAKDQQGRRKGAKSFQLIVYALLIADGHAVARAWRLPQVNEFDVAFVYPYHLNGDGTGLLERGVRIHRLELVEHRAWLDALVKRVEHGFLTGRWPAVPDPPVCAICPAQQECPVPPQFRKGSTLERDPEEVAEEWMFLNQDADHLRVSLKEHVKRFGPIRLGSMELSHKRADSRRMSKAGKALLEAGKPVPASEYVTSESVKFGVYKAGEGF